MLFILVLSCLLGSLAAAQNITTPSQCSCGYVDPSTELLFTDSIIIYFNETGTVDSEVFTVLDYSQRVQRGWNTIFRQGASSTNVGVGNNDSLPWQDAIDGTDPSLELFLNAPTWNHDTIGAELKSVRQDILFGTFRASMRSAQPWSGGSAMSMVLQYNDSEVLQFDMLNMDAAPDAKILQTINGEYPSNDLATNYSTIQAGNPPQIPPKSPWDFLELRMDWTNETVDFFIENNNTRHVTAKDRTLLNVPAPLVFEHWSTGDSSYMMGPPMSRSVANLRWVRAFFNSSLMTTADHQTYDQNCAAVSPCSIDDMTLRGSSDYTVAATLPWKQPDVFSHIRTVAGYVAAAFGSIGVAAIVNALFRRTKWSKIKDSWTRQKTRKSTKALRKSIRNSMHAQNSPYPPQDVPPMPHMGSVTPAPGYASPVSGWQSPAPGYQSNGRPSVSGTATPLPGYNSAWQSVASLVPRRESSGQATPARTPPLSRAASLRTGRAERQASIDSPRSPIIDGMSSGGPPVIAETQEEHDVDAAREQTYLSLEGSVQDANSSGSPTSDRSSKSSTYSHEDRDVKYAHFDADDKQAPNVTDVTHPPATEVPSEKPISAVVHEQTAPDAITGAANLDPKLAKAAPSQRIDYLAGLVAVSCIMVTLRHFSLTFWPYVTEGSGPVKHFAADQILAYILGPYVLTPLWIGPFFVTSCRFMAQRYLRTGKLDDIGNKMLLRAPRLLVPCFIFMVLEYFLLSLGLTYSLESLPSVSFSTWPYVKPQENFGVFVNEMFELAYFIPNGAPEVINHYCVGVLWTIPVQLQFSFVTLFAVVIIRDIKTPWKRMMFYTVTIIFGWYASSWSACHWLGLMLADLDISYNWIKTIQSKWWSLYPMLFFATALVLVTPLMLLFNSAVYAFPFMAWENGIHPDILTGRPLLDTVESIWEVYPPYYYPSAGILAFSAGLQIIVEFSTWIQKFLSLKVITFFHPHIMTIYLMHGFIFWSLGAAIATNLAQSNTPYWAILLIVGICCYTLIFVLAIFITPLIDFATKGMTKQLWRWATEVPVPHMPTTAPFSKQLVVGRMAEEPSPNA